MKNKRGFVFIETIIVIVVLSAALLILYSAYNSAINDEKRRLFYDDTAYVYRNYHILDYLLANSNIRNFFETAHNEYFFPIGYETENFFNYGTEQDDKGYLKKVFESFNVNRMLLVSSNLIMNCSSNNSECADAYSKLYSVGLIDYIKRLDVGKIDQDNQKMFLVIEYAEYSKDGNVLKCEDNQPECRYYYASVEITKDMLNRFRTGNLATTENVIGGGRVPYDLTIYDGYFGYNLDKYYVRTINLVTYIDYDSKKNAVYVGDISEQKNKSIEMWYIKDDKSEMFDLYIGTNSDTIKANANSSYLFAGFKNLESINGLDIMDFSDTTNFSFMFGMDNNLKKVDFSSINTPKLTNVNYMFYCCTSLNSIDLRGLDTSMVTDFLGMFYYCSSLTTIDLSQIETIKANSLSKMFYYCTSLTTIDLTPLKDHISDVSNLSYMFYYCSSLTKIDISAFSTINKNKLTDISYLFGGCKSLTYLNLTPLKGKTSNVKNFSGMFYDCQKLISIDLSPLDTEAATDMSQMFCYCKSLESIDVTPLKTSNVTSFGGMFMKCEMLTIIDLNKPNFKITENAQNLNQMFRLCSNIETIKFPDEFTTKNVSSMYLMFEGCTNLKALPFLKKFNTSKITNMGGMFAGCQNITSLDLSSFNTSKVTQVTYIWDDDRGIYSISGMFQDCKNLTKIIVSEDFDMSNVTTKNNKGYDLSMSMFSGATSIKGENGTTYDEDEVNVRYARVDGKDGLPGYFTYKAKGS